MGLQVRSISKSFGPSKALRGVSLTVPPGEVHGLVGLNGSGKSTLVKILSGYHQPDPGGEIRLDGQLLRPPVPPRQLCQMGMGVVHQDLGLVDSFSVLENIRVGSFAAAPWTRVIRWRREAEITRSTLARLRQEISLSARAADLSAAERATVAIARALQGHLPGRGLIMFDESTRALPLHSLDHFFELVRAVTDSGTSVLLVSHRLQEVLAHADRISVLREGCVVGDGLIPAQTSETEVMRLMLGYEPEDDLFDQPRSGGRGSLNGAAARVENVTGSIVRDVSLTVGAGEIVGVTGLLGSGFDELPYLVSGSRRSLDGALTVSGTRIDLRKATPARLIAAGVAFVPERRDRDGLAASMTVQQNITLPRVRSRGSPALIGARWQREEADWVVRTLGVTPPDPSALVAHLSGGNQQKVLLGKWLSSRPALLVLHEPTQGVDVQARTNLGRAILDVARGGCGVLLASIDATELASLCGRVLVMKGGRIAAELADDVTVDHILSLIYGSDGESSALGEPA